MSTVPENDQDHSPLTAPLFALWGLGGVVGIPTILYAMGFLSDKGHYSLLGLPTGLLRTASDQIFYQGALYLVLTLKNSVWTWWMLVSAGGAVAGVRIWPRIRGTSVGLLLRQDTTRMWMLIVLGGALNILAARLIGFVIPLQGGSIGDAGEEELMRILWLNNESGSWREGLYRAISYGDMVVALGLLWLLRMPLRPRAEPRSITMSAVHFAALILCILSIVNWPICYGRLLMPYERPWVELRPEDRGAPWQGYVLNPHGDLWTVWQPGHNRGANSVVRVYELKSTPPFELLRYGNVLAAAMSQGGQPADKLQPPRPPASPSTGAAAPAAKKPSVLEVVAKLIWGSNTDAKYISALQRGRSQRSDQLEAYRYDIGAKKIAPLNLPKGVTSVLLHSGSKTVFYVQGKATYSQALTAQLVVDTLRRPVRIETSVQVDSLLGFAAGTPRWIVGLAGDGKLIRIDTGSGGAEALDALPNTSELQLMVDQGIAPGGASAYVEAPHANLCQISYYPQGDQSPDAVIVASVGRGETLAQPRFNEDGSQIVYLKGPVK